MDIRSLYQEVIVDHNRNPRNYGELQHPTCFADGYNPLCGDKIKLFLEINEDIITDVKFSGCGCAISTASASLMTDFLLNKTCDQANEMFDIFHDAIVNHNVDGDKKLGKLAVLTGVREFPARVKCATLAWHTLRIALQRELTTAITE